MPWFGQTSQLLYFCFRTQLLSLRERETGLKDMTGILRRMSSRPFLRLIRSESRGRRDTIRTGPLWLNLYICILKRFTSYFLLAFYWNFVKTSIGWKAKRKNCWRRQWRSWSRASVWSKLLLCFNRIHLSLYQRSKSRFPNSNQRRIMPWKSNSNNAALNFCYFNICC